MPWWGWLIIIAVVVIGLPLKLKVYKKMLENRKQKDEEDF